MKKLLACLMVLAMVITMASSIALADTVKLEVDIDGKVNEGSLNMLRTLFEEFTQETGIEVEVVSNGADHEAIMKTRMASNSMPDMWTTHGWSVLRYGDYAMDLSGESWAAQMDNAIATVVTDKTGKVDGCPLTEWIYGIVFDQDVFAKCGVDPYAIKTWDDLFAACETIAANGIVPIAAGTKGDTYLAGYLEMMNSYFTIDNAPYPANEALQNGTFDFTKNTQLLANFATLFDNGWINKDIFTADRTTSIQYLGTGEYAMRLWSGTSDLSSMKRYFPDRSYGFLAIPAVLEGGNAAITVGEGTCFAVSKNTEHPDECLALLNFLTRPDAMTRYVEINGGLPGLTGIDTQGNVALEMLNKAVQAAGDNLSFSNFFDREYLPSGMWNAMQETMDLLFNGEVGTAQDRIDDAAQNLQDAYTSLY